MIYVSYLIRCASDVLILAKNYSSKKFLLKKKKKFAERKKNLVKPKIKTKKAKIQNQKS